MYTCSTCLILTCAKCGALNPKSLDPTNAKVLYLATSTEKIDTMDCAQCRSTTQRSEGCNHMECKASGEQICYMDSEVCDYLTEESDSFYDTGYGDHRVKDRVASKMKS